MPSFLDTIRGEKKFSTETELNISRIPLEKIKPDPEQVRKSFDEVRLKELADSIKEKGLQNPIHVRMVSTEPEEYIIIMGERRFRASQIAVLGSIDCIVHKEPLTPKDIKSLQLIENLQREDLNIIETSRGFEALMKEGMSQREISRNLGIPEGTVSKCITILKKLPAEWITELEALCQQKRDIPLYQIYEVAKEPNKNRRKILYDKMLQGITEVSKTDEPILEDKNDKEEESEQVITSQENEQFDVEQIWEALKKLIKKDKGLLLKYISPNKIKRLLEDTKE